MLILAADPRHRRHAGLPGGGAGGGAGARAGAVMTLGLHPTAPATAYGYIQPGEPVEGGRRGAARRARFHEKPDAARAAG